MPQKKPIIIRSEGPIVGYDATSHEFMINHEYFKISGEIPGKFLAAVIRLWKQNGKKPVEFHMDAIYKELGDLQIETPGRLLKHIYKTFPELKVAFKQVPGRKSFYTFNPASLAQELDNR